MITIPGSAAGLVLGFLLASIYGGVFHLIFGGPIRRILVYLFAAWVGFFVGQFIGDFFNFDQARQRFVGRKTRKIYQAGDELEVVVARVDPFKQQLDFAPA